MATLLETSYTFLTRPGTTFVDFKKCAWPLLEAGRCCSVSVYTGAPPSTSQCLNSSRGQAQICVNCYSKCTQQILTKPVFLPIVHFTSIITISITIITIMTLTTTITQPFTITITNIIITTTTTKLYTSISWDWKVLLRKFQRIKSSAWL